MGLSFDSSGQRGQGAGGMPQWAGYPAVVPRLPAVTLAGGGNGGGGQVAGRCALAEKNNKK